MHCLVKVHALLSMNTWQSEMQQRWWTYLAGPFSMGSTLWRNLQLEKKKLTSVISLTQPTQRSDLTICVTTWLCVQKTWFNVHELRLGRWGRLNLDWRSVPIDRFLVRQLGYESAYHMADDVKPWQRMITLSMFPKTIGLSDLVLTMLFFQSLKTCTILKTQLDSLYRQCPSCKLHHDFGYRLCG